MVEIPTSVRIGPLLYEVVTTSDIKQGSEGEPALRSDSSWAAYSDHRHCIIAVNPDEAPSALRLSLLHEVMHAALRLSGCWIDAYAYDHITATDPSDVNVEEHAVAGLAGPMLGVLRDNPQLLAYLRA